MLSILQLSRLSEFVYAIVLPPSSVVEETHDTGGVRVVSVAQKNPYPISEPSPVQGIAVQYSRVKLYPLHGAWAWGQTLHFCCKIHAGTHFSLETDPTHIASNTRYLFAHTTQSTHRPRSSAPTKGATVPYRSRAESSYTWRCANASKPPWTARRVNLSLQKTR